jgi:hypothetical protein
MRPDDRVIGKGLVSADDLCQPNAEKALLSIA